MASPQLAAPDLVANQNNAHTTVNEAVAYLDAHVHLSVKDRDLTAPPGSPANGDRYLIAASPTGAWAGQAGKVAFYLNGSWKFSTPSEGWFTWVDDENRLLRYTGSAWVEVSLVTAQSKGIAVLNPTATDNTFMFFTQVAITITKAVAVVRGSSTPSVTYQVKHDTSRAGSGNNLFSAGQVITSTTTGSTVTSGFNDATVPANSFVWLTTSAVSGTVNEFDLSLHFTED